MREWFLSLSGGEWLPLWLSEWQKTFNFGISAALAPISYRPTAVSGPGWDLNPGAHAPGFSQSYEGGPRAPKTEYHRLSCEPVEPLVIDHQFHGVRPDFFELSEELRMYHNLAPGGADGELVKFDDAGMSSVAAHVDAGSVEIKTILVRQFQAAKQMDLLLFIDSVVYYDPASPTPEDQTWQTDVLNATLNSGDGLDKPFTRFLATHVVPPWPLERCGVWPFEPRDSHFPDFIVGIDADGQPQRFTCDPDRVGNYFGRNPNAPLYVTPVHFRRDVLAKYYDRPDLYSIEDGYLRCAGLWGIRIDNDLPDQVIVMLGDLGRDLPAPERDYWRSFNVPPSGGFSETAFRRGFLAEFADPSAADLRIQNEYRQLETAWREHFGWPLYREAQSGDAHLLGSLRRPLHDTDTEFEELVRTATKLVIDLLNERELARSLPPGPPDERGIAKLERWLRVNGYGEVDRDIRLLRNLQNVRSKGAAHSKGSDYERVLSQAFGPLRRTAAADKLLADLLNMLTTLREFATA
jgi:hypothetical protein